MFHTFEEAQSFIRDRNIEMIDMKFCDMWGRWRHITVPARAFTPSLMEDGVGFDGYSVGFKGVSAGDMVLVPDLATGFIDPFWEVPTLSFICTTLEADTRQLFSFGPRSIAQRAEAFLRDSGIADASEWGPEFEFYLFDGVSYQNGMNVASYRVESREADWCSQQLGSGHAIAKHGGYHAIPPQDQLYNARTRISTLLQGIGVEVKYHHHEVGGPGQCEIETPILPMLKAADATLIAKYVTRMAAAQLGMTATFMPKPLYGEAGSGMHFHQLLTKGGKNLFYDPNGYGSLSDLARHYIAGVLLHGGAVMAFTNASTNSYRRLIPGFEAPVSAIYSLGNRSAAIRIPKYANRPESARFEFRPPDAMSNPYLAIAAQLLAGIDGIKRKLDPTELGFGPVDEDIFGWPAEKRALIKALPTSMDEAMKALAADHEFLLAGGVFSKDLIERWILRKNWEEREVRNRPHPYEIELYYGL
jgi:glutamine synthetase